MIRTDDTNEDGYCIGRVYYGPDPDDYIHADLTNLDDTAVSTCEQWRERHPAETEKWLSEQLGAKQ